MNPRAQASGVAAVLSPRLSGLSRFRFLVSDDSEEAKGSAKRGLSPVQRRIRSNCVNFRVRVPDAESRTQRLCCRWFKRVASIWMCQYRSLASPWSADGKPLPYALGWFVQKNRGYELLWHYGHGLESSSLIVKIPERRVTFVILANSDGLSRWRSLGDDADVSASPAATLFLNWYSSRQQLWNGAFRTVESPCGVSEEASVHQPLNCATGRQD